MICGHDMLIFLSKAGRIPNAVGYFTGCEERGQSIYEEYWECAFCMEPDSGCPYPYETTMVVWNEDGSIDTEKKVVINKDMTWDELYDRVPLGKEFGIFKKESD
jgi:Fe-S oxidoreductase